MIFAGSASPSILRGKFRGLYHGTATRLLPSIQAEGLTRQNRHHVHLSADFQTAQKVGKRYGKLVILVIDAKQMSEDGYGFYCSD